MEVQDYQAVTYPVVETFHSVQGEGYWTGVNAFFIRLGGCDVHCPWCDQKETWSSKGYPLVKSVELAHIAEASNCAIVIITGGEPLLHDLLPLTTSLKNLGLRIHLETSGAHPLRGEFDWLTFSPKPYRAPQQSVISQADELKVVIQKPEDIIWAETQAKNIP
ncbi:MAG: 7-carboxy-7-deazaguanine synthase QueE, partial [Cyanobacteria bacterium J083]